MRFVTHTKTQWRVMREKRLLAEAEEAIVHEWSKFVIIVGGMMMMLLFLIRALF